MIVYYALLIVQLYFSYRPQWLQNNIRLIKFSGDWNNWFNSDKPLYASPTSREAYRNWRLTTNFELWVEIFCVPTCFHMRIPKTCLSVRPSICPYSEKRNHLSLVNVSPTLIIDASMEWSSRVLHHGNSKMWFFFKWFEIDEIYFCPYPEFLYAQKRNRPDFVNTSPTLVIDMSTERSSRVLQHGNQFFFSKKFEIEFDLCWRAEITLASSISPTLVIDTSLERSSRVLLHRNPKIWFFLKFEIRILTKSWNHLSFVNISPTLVIDTSMERSSRVLQHGNPKIWFFFSKKYEIEFCLYPDFPYAEKRITPWLCWYQSYISNWYVNEKVFTSTTTWEPKN